jgi:hypothetical protein
MALCDLIRVFDRSKGKELDERKEEYRDCGCRTYDLAGNPCSGGPPRSCMS